MSHIAEIRKFYRLGLKVEDVPAVMGVLIGKRKGRFPETTPLSSYN